MSLALSNTDYEHTLQFIEAIYVLMNSVWFTGSCCKGAEICCNFFCKTLECRVIPFNEILLYVCILRLEIAKYYGETTGPFGEIQVIVFESGILQIARHSFMMHLELILPV